MIKKEFKDIIKPTALRIVTGVLIIFLFYTALRLFGRREAPVFTDLIYFLTFLLWIPILWIAYNLGINMFKKERTDNAMEYLLSSPVTRSEIFIKKIIPRLIMLILLILSYYFIYRIYSDSDVFKEVRFIGFSRITFVISATFFCSVFISLYEWGNIRSLAWLIITFPVYHLSLILDHFLHLNIVSDNSIVVSVGLINISIIIITIILGAGFYFSYKSFDIRTQRIIKNKFVLISGIPLILIVLVSLFIGITQNI